MEKSAIAELLKEISTGEIDLDRITEVLRSTELVITSYRNEVEGLHRSEESLKQQFDDEKKAVDDLAGRLVKLHEENRLAKEVFRTEIEGKYQVLGIDSLVDLEALDMAALVNQRETVQKQMGRVLTR